MNAVEHRLTAAVRDLLLTYPPSAMPEGFQIRAEQEIEKLERPYLVVSAEAAGNPHPLVRQMTLTLTTVRRADDEGTSPPEELHQLFVNALQANLGPLADALAVAELRLLKMVPGATGEEIVAGRGESSSAAWAAWLQIL